MIENISIFINQVVEIMVSFGPLGGFLLVLLESIFPPLPYDIVTRIFCRGERGKQGYGNAAVWEQGTDGGVFAARSDPGGL